MAKTQAEIVIEAIEAKEKADATRAREVKPAAKIVMPTIAAKVQITPPKAIPAKAIKSTVTKENIIMAKTATKKTAAKKETKAAVPAATPRAERIITLKKMPKDEGSLPAQAVAILQILKSKNSKLSYSALLKAMESKIETSQPIAHIFAFYRKRLIDGGFINIQAA